jgi:hypothetical protein
VIFDYNNHADVCTSHYITFRKYAHVTEVIGWSDNGSHFANNVVFSRWGVLGHDLAVDVVWNFTEPGEGKSDCDRHFAQIKPRILDYVVNSQDGKLEGPAQLAAACKSINNTTGVVLKQSGRDIKQYMTVKGIKLYFSFKLPNNGRKFGDAGYLHARYMTESGDWVILPAGTSQTRQSRD